MVSIFFALPSLFDDLSCSAGVSRFDVGINAEEDNLVFLCSSPFFAALPP